MANPSKQKGTAFETACVNFLRKWFARIYRPALQGGYDTGDINGIMKGAEKQFIFQCKNHKAWDLSGWLNATKSQAAANTVTSGFPTLGALLVKRRGVGSKAMGKTYAVMELEDLATLLKEAGYT